VRQNKLNKNYKILISGRPKYRIGISKAKIKNNDFVTLYKIGMNKSFATENFFKMFCTIEKVL